jgi:hypothetical protein
MNAGESSQESFVPMTFKRRGNRQVADMGTLVHDPTIIEGVGRAFHWQRLLDNGEFESGSAIARAEGLHRTTVNVLLRLTLLAPDIVQRLLAGRQPRRLTLQWLLRNALPIDWDAQRQSIRDFE